VLSLIGLLDTTVIEKVIRKMSEDQKEVQNTEIHLRVLSLYRWCLKQKMKHDCKRQRCSLGGEVRSFKDQVLEDSHTERSREQREEKESQTFR